MNTSIMSYDVISGRGIETMHFSFPYHGNNIIVAESYCVTSECTCNEVVLGFFYFDAESVSPLRLQFVCRMGLDDWLPRDYEQEQLGIDAQAIAETFRMALQNEGRMALKSHYREAKQFLKKQNVHQ